MTKLIKARALDRVEPPAAIVITELGRKLRAEGRSIVSLSIGEPDLGTPKHVTEGAYKAALKGETTYSPIGGIPDLKQAVRDKFSRENGLTFADNEVTVSAGGKQVLSNVLYATLNPGDEVVIPAPFWLAYSQMVQLYEGVPVIVNTSAETGFKATPEDLEAAITDKTKWVMLNSPGNPSGAVYSETELRALAQVLSGHPHVWVLSDDMYEHLIYTDAPFKTMAQVAPELHDRTLTVNGVSKAYAMTGWRVGYAGGPAELIKAMEMVQSQTTSGTSRISQWAAVTALTGPQDSLAHNLEIYRKRRTLVVEGLNSIDGVECLWPDGAFYAYPSCGAFIGGTTAEGVKLVSDKEFSMALLQEKGVTTVHGTAFGLSPHFRVSYAASEADIKEAIARIADFCGSINRR